LFLGKSTSLDRANPSGCPRFCRYSLGTSPPKKEHHCRDRTSASFTHYRWVPSFSRSLAVVTMRAQPGPRPVRVDRYAMEVRLVAAGPPPVEAAEGVQEARVRVERVQLQA